MNQTPFADPIIRGDSDRVIAVCAPGLARLSGKTVLVTGATGFIGGSIVDALLAFNSSTGQPCNLLLPTRSIERAAKLRPDLIDAPNVRLLEWKNSHSGDSPEQCDFIVHAAAPADPALIARNPLASALEMVDLTRRVVGLARQHAVESLLFLSSGAVYGPQPPEMQAIPESYDRAPSLSAPSTAYGETKRYCELLCALSGVNATAARLFACIGPRQALTASFAVPDFFRQAFDSRIIRVKSDGKAVRTFCYISDAVTVLLKLLTRGESGPQTCNVGAEAPIVSIADVASLIATTVGGIDVVIEGSTSDSIRSRYVPDISRMKQLHHPQVGLEEGIHRVASSLGFRTDLRQQAVTTPS